MAKKVISKKVQHKVATRRFIPLYWIFAFAIFFTGILFFSQKESRVEVLEGLNDANIEKIQQEEKIREMVKGYPIEQMVPYITERDPVVAAFLVSIAKKESNWGERTPKYNGEECFNYWGYRGPNRVASGGHSCFNNPKEAVDTVASRIEYLVQEGELDTPEEMIIWKCGSSCRGHSSFSVTKWISDVSIYFDKLTTTLWKH